MNKTFIRARNDAIRHGVSIGALAMSCVTLVSCENVLPDYIEEEKLSEVYRNIEEDMQRVWAEASLEHNPQEIGDYLIGIVEQIRKKRNMGGITE